MLDNYNQIPFGCFVLTLWNYKIVQYGEHFLVTQ